MFSLIVCNISIISLKESILSAIAISDVIACKQAYTSHDSEGYNCQYYPHHTQRITASAMLHINTKATIIAAATAYPFTPILSSSSAYFIIHT